MLDKNFSDPALIVFLFHCGAVESGVLKKSECLKGLSFYHINSFSEFKTNLVKMRGELNSYDSFQQIYEFAFKYNIIPPKNFILVEDAIPLYTMLLPQTICRFATDWIDYLKAGKRKELNKDAWNTFGEFLKSIHGDMKNFNDSGI
jgi:hypothetical protein